jgi:hypothetical protein
MPKNPSKEERIKWHVEHAENCTCRLVPQKLQTEIDQYKTICGIDCTKCQFLGSKCKGCTVLLGKPFWISSMKLTICPLYDCCVNKKKLKHCGLCEEFACTMFMTMEENDPGLTKEQAQKSAQRRKDALLRKKGNC